jgi:hypothetical protein
MEEPHDMVPTIFGIDTIEEASSGRCANVYPCNHTLPAEFAMPHWG